MFVVPGMQLIPQRNNTSCWYASAMMLIKWKRSRARVTVVEHPDPSQTPQTVAWEVAANGLTNPNVLRMAGLLGLRAVSPMSPTLQAVQQWLMRYGPLWTNGKTHIVVIAGVNVGRGTVLVYDPWPPHTGKIQWRSYSRWYIGNRHPRPNEPNSSRDTGADVEAAFLYHP